MLSLLSKRLLRPQALLCVRRFLSTTFEEPSRPGLFYHLVHSETRPLFAVSLLDAPPRNARSPTVIGLLPAPTAHNDAEADAGATFDDFVPNPAFLEILHRSLRTALARGVDAGLETQAVVVHDGWVHINDERNDAAKTGDRIGSPDDIVGTVYVKDGKIQPETFEPMPAYRVCTPDGVVKLSDPMMEHLLQTLRSVHESEHA